MHDAGITRAELANRLGKSRGWVTQLLDGEANKTIRTVADAFAVLGHEFRSFSQPIRLGKMSSQTVSTGDDLSTIRRVRPEDRFVVKMHSTASAIPDNVVQTAAH